MYTIMMIIEACKNPEFIANSIMDLVMIAPMYFLISPNRSYKRDLFSIGVNFFNVYWDGVLYLTILCYLLFLVGKYIYNKRASFNNYPDKIADKTIPMVGKLLFGKSYNSSMDDKIGRMCFGLLYKAPIASADGQPKPGTQSRMPDLTSIIGFYFLLWAFLIALVVVYFAAVL